MTSASNIRFWVAFVVSLIAAIPTAYLGWYFTSKIIASVHVSSDPTYWMERARNEAYGICYDGCYDCLNPSVIETACRLTAIVEVPGVICDFSQIWTWDGASKYPEKCLVAVGDIYKEDALAWKRFWYKPLYLLAFSAAAWIGFNSFHLSRGVLDKYRAFEYPPRYQRIETPSPGPLISTRKSSNVKIPLLATAIVLLALPSPVLGYTCTSQPAYNALFSNADDTIYGVIHGWLSSCYEESYSCGETCTSSGSLGDRSCDTIYCGQERTAKAPRHYVNQAAERVVDCGFRMVDFVPGVVDRRIPNPRIEGKLWVKLAVNRFNGTDSGGESRVDEMVKCLYDIVDSPKW
ncbi:hypothetical protein BKA65DRAFT_516676 [Rhexocercosporidium sp. MPI-PUGE-AT-0058]|nr:hypothetical protein BKA65DRAFT_516676 [Rhexocercosporidium sp. MPI-PUGE-AT-0058]